MSHQHLNRDLDRIAASLAYVLSEANITVDQFADKLSQFYPNRPSPTNIDDGSGLTVENCELYSDMAALWRRGHEFVNEEGEPKPLPVNGSDPSVASLLAQAMKQNKGARTTLEETVDTLIQHGMVSLDPDGLVRLEAISFTYNTVGAGLAMQFNRLAVFSETVAHNTRHKGGRFDRAATAASFPSQAIPLVNVFLEESGMQFLEVVDDYMGKLINDISDASSIEASSESGQRVTVGVYFSESDALQEG